MRSACTLKEFHFCKEDISSVFCNHPKETYIPTKETHLHRKENHPLLPAKIIRFLLRMFMNFALSIFTRVFT